MVHTGLIGLETNDLGVWGLFRVNLGHFATIIERERETDGDKQIGKQRERERESERVREGGREGAREGGREGGRESERQSLQTRR